MSVLYTTRPQTTPILLQTLQVNEAFVFLYMWFSLQACVCESLLNTDVLVSPVLGDIPLENGPRNSTVSMCDPMNVLV